MSDRWAALQASQYKWPPLREVAKQSGISGRQLRRLLKAGKIQGIQRGLARRWHVDPASLEQWIAARLSSPKSSCTWLIADSGRIETMTYN